MRAKHARWMVSAVVVMAVGLTVAGTPARGDTNAWTHRGQRYGPAEPQIEPALGPVSHFSPNGDHRRDHGRITFTLDEAARVKLTVRDDDGLVRGPVRLGRLSAGRHVWRWSGDDNTGTPAADGLYVVELTATTAGRSQTARTSVVVDTVRPRGRLVTTRPTAYPEASAVNDHVQLVWVLDGWNPAEEDLFPEDDLLAWSRIEIRTPGGGLRWRRTVRNRYTPVVDWFGQRDRGGALPAGRYVARAIVSDAAGNRRRGRQDLWVSHAQLVEETWSVTVPAARARRYDPYFGGCLGCSDSAGPVASERFPEGLSFAPATESWQWGTAAYFGSDVPFVEAPVDTYRITAAGGPTTPGSSDQGQLDGTDTGLGDAMATTSWAPVRLAGDPFLPAEDLPVTWSFRTFRPDSYDVATFTVEYKHYVPEGSPRGRGRRPVDG